MRMPGLDLLRVIAGLALIICHAGFWLAPFGLPDTFWMFLGHAGVEWFLLAMGFLFAQRAFAAEIAPSITRSWARSAFRLWPLYLLLLILNLFLMQAGESFPPIFNYLTLTQNLAWPHPHFFGEAWIVAAAALVLIVVPVLCRLLQSRSFVVGAVWLSVALLAATALRGLLVWAGDPMFDVGVRKILIARLDLPIYGVLAAWIGTHRYAAIMPWRGAFAGFGILALAGTAWMHMFVPLDHSLAARIFMLSLCDLGWVLLLPWAWTLQLPDRLTAGLSVLAASAYAGLLTHVTILRLAQLEGVSLHASDTAQGILTLSSYVLLSSGVAILLCVLVDRPLHRLRECWLPAISNHPEPVAKR